MQTPLQFPFFFPLQLVFRPPLLDLCRFSGPPAPVTELLFFPVFVLLDVWSVPVLLVVLTLCLRLVSCSQNKCYTSPLSRPPNSSAHLPTRNLEFSEWIGGSRVIFIFHTSLKFFFSVLPLLPQMILIDRIPLLLLFSTILAVVGLLLDSRFQPLDIFDSTIVFSFSSHWLFPRLPSPFHQSYLIPPESFFYSVA